MNVVVIGSLGYDYIMDFPGLFRDRIMPDKIHNISLSFLVDRLSKNYGGTAGNIAYTLKLLGIEPYIHSAVGSDFGPYLRYLQQLKIKTNYIYECKNELTGAYFGITDKNDNQIGSYYQGALIHHPEQSLAEVIEPVSFVIISPTHPHAITKFVRECQKKNLPYLYDPAFQIDHFSQTELFEALSHATIFIGNDYEIALVEKKLKLTHEKIIGLVPIVVTTMGSKGSLIETKNKKLEIRAAKAENSSDPTGAGDAYRAGFVSGFLRGFDLNVCGRMASVAAVYTVEKYGTQTHTFNKKEFCDRYFANYHQNLNL